jgi:hypothetical protein
MERNMAKSYLPSTDARLLIWAATLSHSILQDHAKYGVTLQQAQELDDRQVEYSAAFFAAVNPYTRTRGKVAAKSDARERLRHAAQFIVSIIRGQPHLTSAQKIAIGLTVRRPRRRHVKAPEVAPELVIRSVSGNTVSLRLNRPAARRRTGKPADVTGAIIMCAAGEQMPPREAWRMMTTTSSARAEVTFPATYPPGTCVWLAAMWINRRQERGPMSRPVSVHVQFGGIMHLAA